MRADGTSELNEARTRALEPSLPSVLKVTAVNFLGIWWYPFGRESIIIAFDPEYRWLAAAHPSLRYGRILSREPSLSDEVLKRIARHARRRRLRPLHVCIHAADRRTGTSGKALRHCALTTGR